MSAVRPRAARPAPIGPEKRRGGSPTMEAVQHYTAYRPKPFTPAERKDVTILFGGLTWKHERLVQGAMENVGYNTEPLPNVARADLDAGRELIDVGACCPTT